MAAGAVLERLLTADGYEAIRQRNWTLTGLSLGVLGTTADLSELIGPVTLYGLLASLAGLVVFGLAVLLRTRFCRACAAPLMVMSLAVLMFGVLYGSQRLFAAEKEGLLAKQFPGAQRIQIAILDAVQRLGGDVAAIRRDMATGEDIAGLRAELKRVYEAIEAKGEVARAERAGVARTTVIALARRLKPGETLDFD